MNPSVILTTEGGQICASLTARVSQEWFSLFRQGCYQGGARWVSASRKNLAPLYNAIRLKAAMESLGFVVQVANDAAEDLAGAAIELRGVSEGVRERLLLADGVLSLRGARLAPYQAEGAEWIAPCDRALLGDQQGLGKTLQLLCAAPAGPVMVVCPSVAKGVWNREALAFRPDLTRKVLEGRGSAVWPASGEVVILNYELLPATWAELEAARQADEELPDDASVDAFWNSVPEGCTLILDEAQFLKSNKTARTARARSLIKAVLKQGGRVWGATGTPLLNRQLELWNLLTTLQLHREAFGDFLKFAELFGALKGKWGQYVWPNPKDGVSPEIATRLKRVMLRRLRRDVLPQLPEKIRQDVPVEITAAARRMLDKVAADLAAKGITIEDAIAAAEMGRLADPAFEELSRANEELARAMIPAAIEIAESYEEAGEPLIVWSDHRAPVLAFRDRPGWATIEGGMSASQKTAAVEAFQAGKLKGIACSIRAGGTAITLTYACAELFVDLSYVPGENEQAEDRAVRHGQTRGVVCRRLVPDHILCQRKHEIITGKMELISGTVDAAAVVKATPKVAVEALEKLSRGEL
ncbi:MAG: DEAD/DEAH box helicase [Bacteroidota bacterium]